jgi:hypothetical protein
MYTAILTTRQTLPFLFYSPWHECFSEVRSPVRSCPQRLKARGLALLGVFSSLDGRKGNEGGMIGTLMEVAKACRVPVAYPVRLARILTGSYLYIIDMGCEG